MAAGPVGQRLAVVREGFRSKIWPLPVLGVALATGLGILLPELDARYDDEVRSAWTGYLFTGGPDAARSVLSAVAGSLVTLTSLTFSLTVVTLQLASSQFSPRLLRTFSSDRFVHVTLMLFVSTFVYALTVLRTVRTSTDSAPGFVPQIAVTLGLVLALASVLALVLFLSHLASEIRVETMLRRVYKETRATALRVTEAREGDGEDIRLPVPPAGRLTRSRSVLGLPDLDRHRGAGRAGRRHRGGDAARAAARQLAGRGHPDRLALAPGGRGPAGRRRCERSGTSSGRP